MKRSPSFIPLNHLIPALDDPSRLYCLYRELASQGGEDSYLRFEWFRESLPGWKLEEIERTHDSARRLVAPTDAGRP